jgi:hypothetical protein
MFCPGIAYLLVGSPSPAMSVFDKGSMSALQILLYLYSLCQPLHQGVFMKKIHVLDNHHLFRFTAIFINNTAMLLKVQRAIVAC